MLPRKVTPSPKHNNYSANSSPAVRPSLRFCRPSVRFTRSALNLVWCFVGRRPPRGWRGWAGSTQPRLETLFFFHFWYRSVGWFLVFRVVPGHPMATTVPAATPGGTSKACSSRLGPLSGARASPLGGRRPCSDRTAFGWGFLGFALLVSARVSPQVTWCGPGRRPTPGHDGVVCLAVGISTRDGWRSIQQTNGATEAQARRGGAFFFSSSDPLFFFFRQHQA